MPEVTSLKLGQPPDDVEGCLAALEKEDKIEQLLAELKAKRGA